jgi:4-amino-4-deoxy-L-arabinose transferase-like glycosyltransferase
MMEVKKNEKYLLWGILLIGFFLRLFLLGRFPAGGAVNVDEATAGYEAYSMLRTGADYTGYVHPMYFYSWGSGMNVLESYCQMPFIAVFGLTAFAVRIPQALLGCITLPAFYELTRRIQNRRFALLSVFLLSVMPWHIMISRWALESNFLPGFLVIAALFLAMSTENSRWFPVSMLFYGLSLYCYAAAWTVMPLIILGPILYLLFSKRLKIDRWILTGAILFCVLAVPVFLLFMVNTGIIGEIRTGFLSVPRMYHFRNSEVAVSPAVFMKRLAASVKMFLRQDDGNVWNFASGYGIYYHFSIFFIVTGLIVSAYSFIRKREAHGLSCIMLCQLAAGILLSAG